MNVFAKMVKRKISDYYASRKKRHNTGGRKTGTKTRSRMVRRLGKGRIRKGRGMGRRSRHSRIKKGSHVKTTVGNLRTLTQQIIDRVSVPTHSGTAGTPDNVGKQCTYYYPGVNQQTSFSLGGVPHCISMASILEVDEASLFVGTNTLSETTYLVKDSQQTYDIVNCSNGAARLTIYYIRCKMDVLNGQSQGNPLATMGDGFFQRFYGQTRGPSNAGIFACDLTPFQSHKFCQYYTVYKQEVVLMDPGSMQTRRLVTGSYPVNMSHYTTQTATGQSSLNATQDYSHRRGEKFLLIKLEGQPANDSAYNLTYTNPAIDVDCRCSYTYQSRNRQAPTLTSLTPINYKLPGTVQIMEDETGAVVNQVDS